jgi:transposase
MPKTRKSHPPSLKAKVAVEAIRAHKTAAQIAQMFDVHPTQVGGWKKQALAGLPDVFGNDREQMREQADAEKDELYKQIGQMKVELDFLKKRFVRRICGLVPVRAACQVNDIAPVR